MSSSASKCRDILTLLRAVAAASNTHPDPTQRATQDEVSRFSLWIGNIGALHKESRDLSLESRLRSAPDILECIIDVLDDLGEVAHELLESREGQSASRNLQTPFLNSEEELNEKDSGSGNEESDLLEEIRACISRLFRVSRLIREASSTDPFVKALSRNRYQFSDQHDIAHVGEKFPKLTKNGASWLQKRLGRAITQRRNVLAYLRDHHDKKAREGPDDDPASNPEKIDPGDLHSIEKPPDRSSQPSTLWTKPTTLNPEKIARSRLTAEAMSDPEDDARSYTTISRSVVERPDHSLLERIPRLGDLRVGGSDDFMCPFCCSPYRFRTEKRWLYHVFSDLRPYVCTFRDCSMPLFKSINDWFRHEMQFHRVEYLCTLCNGRRYRTEAQYIDHLQRRHADCVEDDHTSVVEFSRKPVDRIAATDCPFCDEWSQRLLERARSPIPSQIVALSEVFVVPDDFKRHLAGHLEELALFAIPTIAVSDDGDASNPTSERNPSPSEVSHMRELDLESGSHRSDVSFDRVTQDSLLISGPSPLSPPADQLNSPMLQSTQIAPADSTTENQTIKNRYQKAWTNSRDSTRESAIEQMSARPSPAQVSSFAHASTAGELVPEGGSGVSDIP